MESPARGRVTVLGRDVTKPDAATRRWLATEVQLVLQDPYTALNPRMKVEDIVAEGLDIHRIAPGRAERRRRVLDLLEQVGLDHSSINRYPHEFSGGQRQRIGIARALALDPKLLLCDEPVSALDVSVQAQVLNLLQDLQRERGLGLVIVTHDLTVVDHLADRIAVMYLGRVVEIGPAGQVGNFRHPYAQALRAAAPRADVSNAPVATRFVLSGDLPDPSNPPLGCRFHSRCPLVRPACTAVDPALTPTASAHAVACLLANEPGGIPSILDELIANRQLQGSSP
jgi:oligopeptide/dipeptide ABC transporter ATP-binding protein